MPDDQAKEVPQAGNMADLERVRAGYRKSLDATFIEKLGNKIRKGKLAVAASAAIGLGVLTGTPAAAGSESPTQSPVSADVLQSEAQTRTENLKSFPGNDNALAWRPESNVEGARGFREDFIRTLSSDFDLTAEFDPKKVDSTWEFLKASLWRHGPDDAAFLDGSGRIPAESRVGKMIDELPTFKPFYYHPGEPGKTSFGSHTLFVTNDQVPDGGYVMVFSRPDKAEKADSFYDRWELDSAFSDAVKLKGGHKGQNLVAQGHFLSINSQDRTDRLTPFYNRDNPAKVEKVVLILDKFGQPISKFNLKTTDYYPRQDWLDSYKGNEKAAKENISFSSLHSLTDDERVKWMNSLLGRGGAIKVNTKELRLHWVLENPNYLQVHMLMSERSTTNRYPIEMRVTRRQWEDLKKRFKTVPQDSKEPFSFPGDLIVPEGTDLNFRVDFLTRGDFPGAQFLMLALLNVKP